MRWNKDRASNVIGAGSSTYDSRLLSAINRLGQDVLGKPIDNTFTVPNAYTGIYSLSCRSHWKTLTIIFNFQMAWYFFMSFSGEKIGIEYLYSQTGQVLQSPLQQEEPQDEEKQEDQDDEGFHVSCFSLGKSCILNHYLYTLSISILF